VRRACLLLGALGLVGCAASSGPARSVAAPPPEDPAKQVARFGELEDDAMSWIIASDPRLARRAGETAPTAGTEAVLKRIGMESVMAEDATAEIHGVSLDLFAFRARKLALVQAADRLASLAGALPESTDGGQAGPIARPRLERELLLRLILEEQARAEEEAKLGDAAGDLVRAIVATWAPPATPEDLPLRDEWVSKHLLEIRDALTHGPPRTGPFDLDVALYPLERLLAPLQYPRGSAAIARLRVGLDEDMRVVPKLALPERVALEARVHLGVSVDPATLPARFERTEARLTELATAALAAAGDKRPAVEARARELLLVERSCPAVPGTRVRSMGPPPERAAVCGAVRALTEEAMQSAALVALHDDVILAEAAVTQSPPPRTALLCHPEDDVVDALRRTSRERPTMAIGVALAAEVLYGNDASIDSDARLRAWRALGEAPLDVVARELGTTL
jgi:hypothetical protein